MNDDAKKKILARRAKFVAAALAGLGVACGKEKADAPQPCLTPIAVDDAGTTPMVCLTVTAPAPQPPPPPPDAATARPCLEIMPPKKDAGR